MFMTDLWYVKCNDFVRFETLKCRAVVLIFTKNFLLKFHYLLLGAMCLYVMHTWCNSRIDIIASIIAFWWKGFIKHVLHWMETRLLFAELLNSSNFVLGFSSVMVLESFTFSIIVFLLDTDHVLRHFINHRIL